MNKDTIYFAKCNKEARIPTKRDEDMCYDIYPCFKEEEICIFPQQTKLIPTGICSAFDKKWGISLRERGSNGSIGMKVSAGQIDSGYRGEWFVAITNTTSKVIVIYKPATQEFKKTVIEQKDQILYPYNKAICQAKVEEVPQMQIEEIKLKDLKNITSLRGEGKLGSSGK